ncbi:MAG TPA: UDP-N-acetylmuramate--L-alanine ligase [Candidatus Baltobacteraceae bacterium]|nr:UDP-N-acetylmuramate--L-alanine ligase [Candidatus Baltobacteraceae bacterium]
MSNASEAGAKTWHFVGIGGIGMSAIARILLARGQRVSGSDLKETALIAELREEGADVRIGHDAANVDAAHTVVVSSAIDRRNPEYLAAQRRGIPLLHRGEMLAELLRNRSGVGVCGTHGKTTTTAMIAAVLRAAGVDASLALGGIDGALGTNAYDGRSAWFVTEADESDGSFALLDPKIAIVTNIENDHLQSDDELPQLVRAFEEFLRKLPKDGCAIVGVDNPLAASLLERERRARTVTFGFGPRADVRASNVHAQGLGTSFDAIAGEVCLGTIELNVPGTINVQNALAAIAAARELEVPFVRIAEGLNAFRGVRRRFDILVRSDRMVLVDDYAHHPTAVRATIAAARQYHRGPVIVAFQPHRYSRTAYLARDFADALKGADRVYLAPVYAASEPPIPGISERSIGEPLAAAGSPVTYVSRVDELEEVLLRDVPRGALVLMLGAGNITDVAARLARRANAADVKV